MSEWHKIEREDVALSDDGKTIEVLAGSNDWGNVYIEIPVEYIKELIDNYHEVSV